MITLLDYNEAVAFSLDAYYEADQGSKVINRAPNQIRPGWIRYGKENDRPTGFQAFAYLLPNTGELVYAITGTQFDKALRYPPDFTDVKQDIDLAGDFIQTQYQKARDFVKVVEEKLLADQIQLTKRTITGHSLGGSNAQLLGGKLGHKTITFNAAGMQHQANELTASIDSYPGAPYNQITNYIIQSDLTGNAFEHIGTCLYCPGGFIGNTLGDDLAYFLSRSHNLDNFYGKTPFMFHEDPGPYASTLRGCGTFGAPLCEALSNLFYKHR